MSFSASYPIPEEMLDTVRACTIGLGAVGIPGGVLGPGSDLIVIAPVWAGMVVRLAMQSGHHLSESTAKKLAIVVATGCGSFAFGTKVASTIAAWVLALPTAGMSLAANVTANVALNAKFTHAFGMATARYFLQSESFDGTDVAAQIIIALVAWNFGIHLSHPDVTA